MTAPGHLHRRLVLEAPDETPDGAGGVTRTYNAVATLWASVVALAARREIEAANPGALVTHRIVIRRRADITTRHRLRDGSRLFRIEAVRELPRRYLEISAEERAV